MDSKHFLIFVCFGFVVVFLFFFHSKIVPSLFHLFKKDCQRGRQLKACVPRTVYPQPSVLVRFLWLEAKEGR